MAKDSQKEQNGQATEAWARFERAVDAAVKGGPKHKVAPPTVDKKARPASKGRVHKGRTKS